VNTSLPEKVFFPKDRALSEYENTASYFSSSKTQLPDITPASLRNMD